MTESGIYISKYAGLAIRAGEAAFGIDALEKLRRAGAVLIDSGAAERTKKLARECAAKLKAGVVEVDNLGEIAHSDGVKVLAIKNYELAKQILRGNIHE